MNLQDVFQGGVTALLLADPAVAAIVGEKIFDELPAHERQGGPAPPWVFFGPVNRRRLETGCARTWIVTSRLFAASTAFGRREAWQLTDAMNEALEGAEPDLGDDFAIVEEIRCIQAGDAVLPGSPKTVFLDITATIIRTA